MKNFETILSDAGVELTDEQKKAITEDMAENYKPIADWKNQKSRADNLETQLDTAKKSLEKFDGVNVEDLNKQINDLKEDLAKKESEYQTEIADRDFQDILNESISEAKGRNAKAIAALLDVPTLKASKNQKEDIAAAIKVLMEKEDSKMLFGDETEAREVGKGSPIGNFNNNSGGGESDAQIRSIMGLPPVQKQ